MERNTSNEWESWEAQEPGGDFADRVMHELRFERSPAVRARPPRSSWTLATLAGAAALLGSLALLAAELEPYWRTRSEGSERESPAMHRRERASGASAPGPRGTPDSEFGPRREAQSGPAASVSRELRARVREKLAPRLEAHGVERDPHTGLTIPAGHAGPVGNITRDYLQQRIQNDFMPLAGACYEAALSKQPRLAGTLAIDFMIVGDPSVGGIVDQAQVNASSTIHDPELSNCMLESLQSIVFVAPDNYGWVTVTYPFELSPGPSPEQP